MWLDNIMFTCDIIPKRCHIIIICTSQKFQNFLQYNWGPVHAYNCFMSFETYFDLLILPTIKYIHCIYNVVLALEINKYMT